MPLINFSGLASGIDAEALIEATSAATRQQRIVPFEEQVTELEDESSSLEELKDLLDELQEIVEDWMTLNGGVVAKTAQSTDESILTGIASDTATQGTYSITVDQVATNDVFSYTDISGLDNIEDIIDPALTGQAVFEIGTAPAETVTIDVDSETTLSSFISSFNNQSTYATASAVNIGTEASPNYTIVITTNNVGTELGTITNTTVPTTGILQTSTQTNASDAQIDIAGVGTDIQRSSNTINDIIPGLTLNLESADSGQTVVMTVEVDEDETESRLDDFIDKYNEIVAYVDANNEISRTEEGDEVEITFGALASTRVDDGIVTALRSAISGSTFEDGDAIKIFADLGITTERDGTLVFDKTSADNSIANFANAIATDPDAINSIIQNFADVVASTGGTIEQYTRFNGLIDLTVRGNTERIEDLNDRIARAEKAILRTEETLRARFARLEALTSQLQGQQQALTSALAGLGG